MKYFDFLFLITIAHTKSFVLSSQTYLKVYSYYNVLKYNHMMTKLHVNKL